MPETASLVRGARVVVLLVAFVATACDGERALEISGGPADGGSTKGCTQAGCAAQFRATVGRADGTFPSGTHRIEVTADGLISSCSFTFPLETVPGGGTVQPTCPSGLTVFIDAPSIPEQFVEIIELYGTPASIRVHQSVDGATVLDQTAMPSYETFRPNGPECPPACMHAGATWTLP